MKLETNTNVTTNANATATAKANANATALDASSPCPELRDAADAIATPATDSE
jgi:hypothetical protein